MKSKQKILIYTDSRGQHTPVAAPKHEIFANKLAAMDCIDADVILCPMKWTTTIDFLEYIEDIDFRKYDKIILYTGIVDWSPRARKNAIEAIGMHNYTDKQSYDARCSLNTCNNSIKIVNNKKNKFDDIFGKDIINSHLKNEFEISFQGQPTINMYSLDMAKRLLIPRLRKIENLIFINSNKFVYGWNGDYIKDRPNNIHITEVYSKLFLEELGSHTVVNLLDWDNADIKKFTCDNIHLTKKGSDWLYDKICERLNINNAGKERDSYRLGHISNSDTKSSLISVIVPVYNTSKYLEKCLQSLVNQDDYSYEVILVNDGSTDNSDKIIDKFCHNYCYFKKISQNNKGLGSARNRGVSNAIGEFITFVDSDDFVARNYLSLLRYTQYVNFSDITSGKLCCVDEKGNKLNKYLSLRKVKYDNLDELKYYQLILGAFLPSISCCRLYRKSLFIDKNIRFHDNLPHEDMCFTYKIFYNSCKNAFTPRDDIYFYRQHNNSLSKTITSHHINGLFEIWHDRIDFINRNYSSRVNIELLSRSILVHLSGIINRSEKSVNEENKNLLIKIQQYKKSINNLIDIFKNSRFNNTYDISSIENYLKFSNKSSNIDFFRNRFQGNRCFILGNGPSLNKCDLNLLKEEYTFGVNGIFYKEQDCGFKPTFYVVEDNMVMSENIERIKNFQVRYKFFPTDYEYLHPMGENVFFFKMNQGFYNKKDPYYCVPRFSVDASKELFCGQSVTYINLQLAYYMGFTTVYLIGMDFSYIIPEEHMRDGNHIQSTTDDPNHFHKDYFGIGKTYKDPKLDRVMMNYYQAKQSYEAVGRKIYNASIGGYLEVFERVDYYGLLK